MDYPPLDPGEQVLAASPDVYVKAIRFAAFLTTNRIILRSMDDPGMPDKDLPRDTIEDVFSSEGPGGVPVLTIAARTPIGETRRMNLLFSDPSGRSRQSERETWIRHLMVGQTIPPVQAPPAPSPKSSRPVPAHGSTRVPYTEGKLRFNDGIHAAKTNAPASPREYPAATPPARSRSTPPARTFTDVRADRTPEQRKVNIEIRGSTYVPQKPATPSPRVPAPDTCFCNQCGSRVTGDSLYCNHCGAEVIVPEPVRSLPRSVLPERPAGPLDGSTPEPVLRDTVLKFNDTAARREKKPEPLRQTGTDPSLLSPIHVPEPAPGMEEPAASQNCRKTAKERPAAGNHAGAHGMKKGIMVTAAILVCAVIAVFFIFPDMMAFGNSTANNTLSGTPAVTPASATITPRETVKGTVQPTLSQKAVVSAPSGTGAIPPEGMCVRISYTGAWQGSYGTSSSPVQAKGSGEKIYPVEYQGEPVIANIHKTDNAAGDLVVIIYSDGQEIERGSTSAPTGAVSVSGEI